MITLPRWLRTIILGPSLVELEERLDLMEGKIRKTEAWIELNSALREITEATVGGPLPRPNPRLDDFPYKGSQSRQVPKE